MRIVEEAGDGASREHLGALLAFFPPESLGPLLRAGESSGSETARAALMAAAERLAAPNPAALRGLRAGRGRRGGGRRGARWSAGCG